MEIIFYNGFNLLVDIILASVVGFFAYKAGIRKGYIQGYGHGEADTVEQWERAGEYYYQSHKENA